MSASKNMTVSVGGIDITIQTDEDRGYIQKLAAKVDEKVGTYPDSVYIDHRRVVYRAEMKNDSFSFPALRDGKFRFIPQFVFRSEFLLHARQSRLNGKGHQYLSLIYFLRL